MDCCLLQCKCKTPLLKTSALQDKNFHQVIGICAQKSCLTTNPFHPSISKVYKASVQFAYQIWLQPQAQGRRPWRHYEIWLCQQATFQANPPMHTFSAYNKTQTQHWEESIVLQKSQPLDAHTNCVNGNCSKQTECSEIQNFENLLPVQLEVLSVSTPMNRMRDKMGFDLKSSLTALQVLIECSH